MTPAEAVLRHLYRCRRATLSQLCARYPQFRKRQIQDGLYSLRDDGVVSWRGWWPRDLAWWALTEEGHARAAPAVVGRPRPYVRQLRENSHLHGTNEVGAAFCAIAAAYRGDACDWEVEVAHPYGGQRIAVADAVLTYTALLPDNRLADLVRLVEYDRGTETISTLVSKLKAYIQVRRYSPRTRRGDKPTGPENLWQQWYVMFPPILFVFDNMTVAQADRRGALLRSAVAADDYLAANGKLLKASYTSLDLLRTRDPFQHQLLLDIPSGEPMILADRNRQPSSDPLRAPPPTLASLADQAEPTTRPRIRADSS